MLAVGPWLQANGLPAGPVRLLGSMGDEMELFRREPEGHLFVAGRFDGMDFAGAECRVVVLATIPRAVNDQEHFVSDYLRDASFLIGRTNQRIIQALGRCNRDDDDFALYVLADRRLAAHLAQEANRRGLPAAVQAELDLAEELDEMTESDRLSQVTAFLNADFGSYDSQLRDLYHELPPAPAPAADEADHEVKGWLALTGRQDYLAAERHFDARQQNLAAENLRELGAFLQYTQAKAAHLQGLRGDAGAAARSRATIEQAIARGGAASSWFNRLRSSLSRASATTGAVTVSGQEFAAACARGFDEQLEFTPPGVRLDKWRRQLDAKLGSDSHDVYAQGLGELAGLLGYRAVFPRYGAATDCRWVAAFGNALEAMTFECKIENTPGNEINAHAVGQAHNQKARADAELGPGGYAIRGLIVTHLDRLAADAASGLGEIVVVQRAAVGALHSRVNELLTTFASTWSLEDSRARVAAGEALATRLPATGWLLDAIDAADRFLHADGLLAAWPSS